MWGRPLLHTLRAARQVRRHAAHLRQVHRQSAEQDAGRLHGESRSSPMNARAPSQHAWPVHSFLLSGVSHSL